MDFDEWMFLKTFLLALIVLKIITVRHSHMNTLQHAIQCAMQHLGDTDTKTKGEQV